MKKKRRWKRRISLLGYLFLGGCLLLIMGAIFLIITLFNKITKKDMNTTTVTTTTAVIEAEETITISFEANGGDPVDSITINKGESISIPETVRKGYTFKYWMDKDGKTIKAYNTFNEDMTFTAVWEKVEETTTTKKTTKKTTTKAKTVKVVYDSNGGSKVSTQTLTCSNNYITIKTLPKSPTKDGYTFNSWLDKDKKVVKKNTKYKCNVKSITLTAKWTKKESTTTTKKTTKTTTKTTKSTSSSTTTTTTTTNN